MLPFLSYYVYFYPDTSAVFYAGFGLMVHEDLGFYTVGWEKLWCGVQRISAMRYHFVNHALVNSHNVQIWQAPLQPKALSD